MIKIGLFYGSTTNNTQNAARLIQKEFGDNVDIYDIGTASPGDIGQYRVVIFGTSTWGLGDLQDEWALFENKLRGIDFTGKTVALFGLGDQYNYSETFVDAMGCLYDIVTAKGAEVIGAWPVKGYDYDRSAGEKDGVFVGLALDEDNQSDLTLVRIQQWTQLLRRELAQ